MFSERIQWRYELFWKRRRLGLHGKGRCLLTYMSRDDPIEKWHCCDLWQRKLSNKWNAREFAVKYGVRVPELYWSGGSVERIPFDSLPSRYVVRPVVGHSGQGTFVMADGVNLLDGEAYTPEQLRFALRPSVPPWSRRRLLVEEFIRPEDGEDQRPWEYKLHVFGEHIAAVGCLRRRPPEGVIHLDEHWTVIPPLNVSLSWPDDLPTPEPPECFAEMKSWARTLGRAYGTYVRVDFYASDTGCVFGEFAATPTKGRGLTESCDSHFEELWREQFPDEV